MARVFKDHFGNATSQFDRINKFNKEKREKPLSSYPLAEQIKMMEEEEAKLRKEAAAKKATEKAKNDEQRFSGKEIVAKKIETEVNPEIEIKTKHEGGVDEDGNDL